MSFTNDDLTTALDKLGSLEFTAPEIEALTAALADGIDDEVSGFSFDRGSKGWIIIESFRTSGWKVEEGESWKIEQGSAWKIEQG